jgi:hypothetical protein
MVKANKVIPCLTDQLSLHACVVVVSAGEFTMLELANLVKEVVNPKATIEYRENTADDPGKRRWVTSAWSAGKTSVRRKCWPICKAVGSIGLAQGRRQFLLWSLVLHVLLMEMLGS